MVNIFRRADFSKESSAKEEIYQKMMEAKHHGQVVPFGHELSDDDLMQVTAAGDYTAGKIRNIGSDGKESYKKQNEIL